MATLSERLDADYKVAMKAGERLRIDTIRLIKAAVQRVAIEQRKGQLDDQGILQVLAQQAKQRRETIAAAKQGGRQDIESQAVQELKILESYLPAQLSAADVQRLVDEAIAAVGPQQGAIMKFVMTKAAGAADGKLVSQLVAQRLQAANPS